jgi:two-component system, OmpR family, response regulator VanR
MTNNMKKYTLLYAEDDIEIREGYANHFRKLFKTVYLAANGKEALKIYADKYPDILLVDINMPKIDGLTLIENIRKYDKDVKIIILTAHLDEEKLLRAMTLRLVSYLQKPAKKRELESVLQEAVNELEIQRQENDNNTSYKIAKDTIWISTQNKLIYKENEVHLTQNEIIIIKIFTSNAKEYYSVPDIIELFWMDHSKDDMSEESIRNIIKRLKSKLPKETITNNHGIGYKLTNTVLS